MSNKFKSGDQVTIKGGKTTLVHPLTGKFTGGWAVWPKVQNLGYWNEEEMKRS